MSRLHLTPLDPTALHRFPRTTVVLAHMDDEINAVGLLLRLREAGSDTELVVLTDGAANPWTDARVVGARTHFECRRDELHAVMPLVGLSRVALPCFPDSRLAHHLDEAIAFLRTHFAQRQPSLVITFEPSGLNRHPDHCAAHQATTRALEGMAVTTAYLTPPPPFRWVLGTAFRSASTPTVMTLELSAAEREAKARALETYASQRKTLRLLLGGLPPRLFFRLFPHEWYYWLEGPPR